VVRSPFFANHSPFLAHGLVVIDGIAYQIERDLLWAAAPSGAACL
jgi:hypothetical protein